MPEFIVRTLHPETNGRLIAPITIEADSHLAAATKRFKLLLPESKENTKALLVTEAEGGEPRLFDVNLIPKQFEVVPAS